MISQITQRKRLLLRLLCVALLLQLSLAWVAGGSSKPSKTGTSSSSSSSTAKFYSTIAPEEATKAAIKVVLSPTTAKNSLHKAKQLPWIVEGDESSTETTSFLDHWSWQLEFFEEHLANLRVQSLENVDPSVRELYYTTKDEEKEDKATQRVYTISLESDEYRDIRMTYIHCSGMETFRCLSYPRHGDLPIQGMFVMKMGGCKNLSIMDYQPLPAWNGKTANINEIYSEQLLGLRSQIPTMSQPMTHRHFDSDEERKYFSDLPILGRCNELEATREEQEDFVANLWKAQKQYMKTHVSLTKSFTTIGSGSGSSSDAAEYTLERHSDFDAHVSEKEPAGPFLKSVFGPELGGMILHTVIFPLSGSNP